MDSIAPPRPLRRTKGLFDFLMAALCLWAAWFHTPVGALFRQLGAWFFHSGGGAQPLLSYFRTGPNGGAVWANSPLPAQLHGPGGPPIGVRVDPSETLGLGAQLVLTPLWPSRAAHAVEMMRRERVAIPSQVAAPEVWQSLLEREAKTLGSRDAAVVALYAGEEAARFAVERAKAEGDGPTFDALARALGSENEEALTLAGKTLALGTAYGLRWPVPELVPVTSGFGWRAHPVAGVRRFHAGVDLGMPEGSEVRASGSGEVRRASEDALNGKILIVDHGYGVATVYCHNSRLLVREGQAVTAGQVLALSGATGQVTGPHLHFQLELSDVAVDPLRFRRRGPQAL